MEELLEYLKTTYSPIGMISYGSYGDGTQNSQSDFDALLICKDGAYRHDTSFVGDVKLDVFIYPVEAVLHPAHPEEFIQIHDGTVILDESGIAMGLLQQIRDYVAAVLPKTFEEKVELRSWCEKMLRRSERCDAEGLYRGHWLLTDSLEIYCDIRNRFYFGPKKTMLQMEREDPRGFALFCEAMKNRNHLEQWINYIFDIS